MKDLCMTEAGLPIVGSRKSQQMDVGAPDTILVVDDEPAVRNFVCRLLKANGYKTVEAEDGEVAKDIVHESSNRIRLLLTDVRMPGMSGTQLASYVSALYPSLRIVFMSGMADDDLVQQTFNESDVLFIAKPFVADELLDLVRKALPTDAAGSQGSAG